MEVPVNHHFFFFNTLKMLFHCFLTSIISDKKSLVNLIEDLLYRKNQFSLDTLKILSLSFVSRSVMCFSVDLFEFTPVVLHWASWMCRLIFLFKFGEFLAIHSSSIFLPFNFVFFWDSNYVYIDGLVLCHKSLRFCSFFFTLFSFCSLVNNFHWPVFKFITFFLLPAPICVEPFWWIFHFSYWIF